MTTKTETGSKTAAIVVGTRVYNRGDVCNPSHWGTISGVTTGNWGTQVEITPDDGTMVGDTDTPRKPYFVPAAMICSVDKGNGSTRIVTEAAYHAFRAQRECRDAAHHEACAGPCDPPSRTV